jgi:hypothetical protein
MKSVIDNISPSTAKKNVQEHRYACSTFMIRMLVVRTPFALADHKQKILAVAACKLMWANM